ncbi:serine hydrolase, partial [Aegicerativicinus sediminis]
MRSLILSIPFVLICNLGFGQDILQIALASNSPKIEKVTNNLQQYNLQILLTTITKNGDSVSFTDYSFQVNDSSYYYPASTVKFPIAVLAMEKINSIESIDLETPYFIDGDSIEHSIFNDIKNIFAISSNEAFNRLFEFLGKEHINQRLRELEVGPVKIEHRLSTSNSADTIYKSL